MKLYHTDVSLDRNSFNPKLIVFYYNPFWRFLETYPLMQNENELEFGMYPQSMPTEWTHARTLRPWQSVRLDLWRLVLRGL